MLQRFTAALAVAVMTGAALAGCSPPDATPSPSPTATPAPSSTLSDEEAVRRAQASFDRFFIAVDRQFADGAASASALQAFASSTLAASFASSIQQSLDEGRISRGTPTITNVRLISSDESRIAVELCADGSTIETLDATGARVPPAGLVAWSATFAPPHDEVPLMETLDVLTEDLSVCDG